MLRVRWPGQVEEMPPHWTVAEARKATSAPLYLDVRRRPGTNTGRLEALAAAARGRAGQGALAVVLVIAGLSLGMRGTDHLVRGRAHRSPEIVGVVPRETLPGEGTGLSPGTAPGTAPPPSAPVLPEGAAGTATPVPPASGSPSGSPTPGTEEGAPTPPEDGAAPASDTPESPPGSTPGTGGGAPPPEATVEPATADPPVYASLEERLAEAEQDAADGAAPAALEQFGEIWQAAGREGNAALAQRALRGLVKLGPREGDPFVLAQARHMLAQVEGARRRRKGTGER